MKNVLRLVLCVLIFLAIPNAEVRAAVVESGTCGEDMIWTLDDAGVLEISGSGTMMDSPTKEVAIFPNTVKKVVIHEGVTSIGKYAFYECAEMTEVSLPSTLTVIGANAFRECISLEEIEVPSGVTRIDSGAFADTDNLKHVILPQGLTRIADRTFWNSGLTELEIPDSVTGIGELAFYDSGLVEIVIPDSVLTIDAKIFMFCDKLKRVTLPSELTNIGDQMFYQCSSLTEIVLPLQVTSIGTQAFWNCVNLSNINFPDKLLSIGEEAFSGCKKIKEVHIPSGVTELKREVFYKCTELSVVTLPATLTVIDEYAFYGCSSLTEIDIPDNVSRIGGLAFSYTDLREIVVPTGLVTMGTHVFSHNINLQKAVLPVGLTQIGSCMFFYTGLTEIAIPETVVDIGASAFHGTNLAEVVIPESVKSIGRGAFADCKQLENVKLSSGLSTISTELFSGCIGLRELYLPSEVTCIEDSAFSKCEKLEKINIPEKVTTIERAAFANCKSLQEVCIPWGMTEIGEYVFSSCSSLTHIDLPETIETIGSHAFQYCTELEVIELPSQVTKIGSYAFRDCDNLIEVQIPSGVSEMGTSIFNGCDSLIKVSLPENIEEIPGWFFEKCSNLQEVNIPKNVKLIDSAAFGYCKSLTKIEIPPQVEIIGGSAFSNCTELKKINIPPGVESIGNYAFEKCSKLMSIYIPTSVTSIGKNSFSGCSKNMVIQCMAGSYAETYAREQGIKYVVISGNADAVLDENGVSKDSAQTNSATNSKDEHVLKEAVYTEILPIPGMLSPNANLTFAIPTNLVNKYKTITLDWTRGITHNKTITINCKVTGAEEEVKEYVLYMGERKLASSIGGELTVELDESCVGQDYYVSVTSVNGEVTKTALQLKVNASKVEKEGELQFGGSSLFSVTLPSDIPFFGGAKIEFDDLALPIYAKKIGDDTVRVGVNLKKTTMSDEALLEDFEKDWKSLRNKARWGQVLSDKDIKTVTKFLDMPSHKNEFGFNVTIAGYGDGKYDEDGNLIVTLDFMITAKGSKTWSKHVYFLTVPVLLEAKTEFKGELGCEAVIEWSADGMEYKSGDIALDFSAGISVYGGVGVKYFASIGAFGSGKLNGEFVFVSTERDPGFDNVNLVLEAGLKGYVGPLKGELVLANKTWNIYSRPGQPKSLEEVAMFSMYDANLYRLAENDYAAVFVNEQGKEGAVIEDAFISAQPSVIDTDDYVVMTYLTMDPARPMADSTVLMYTVYDKNQEEWSNPQKVDGDNTMDWIASLYHDGEALRLVYVQQDGLLSDDIGISDLTTGMKITTAVFDFEEMCFEGFEDIAKSNEQTYVSRPAVSVKNDELEIYWVQGMAGDYFGTEGPNSIYSRKLSENGWTEASLWADNLNCVTDLAVGEVNTETVVAFVTDTDNNLDTSNDRVVTAITGAGIRKDIADGMVGNIHFETLPGRQGVQLLWYDAGNIGFLSDISNDKELLFEVNEQGELSNSVSEDFTVAGNKILFSASDVTGNSGVYSLIYIDNGFSAPVLATEATGTVTTYTADKDVLIWLDSSAALTEESIDDYSVIKYCMYNEQYDVEAVYAEVEGDNPIPGKQVTVTAEVKNNTDSVLSNVYVTVLNDTEEWMPAKKVSCSIAPGETGVVSVSFNAPEVLNNAIYTLYVTGQQTDTLPENNYTEIDFSKTEFSVSVNEVIYQEEEYLIADVCNDSYVSASATVVFTNKEGNVLHSEVINEISGQSKYSVVLKVDDLLEEGETEKIIFIEVISNLPEYNQSNNKVSKNISVLSSKVDYVNIIFKVGEEEISNTIYPVGTEIVSEELPEGMMGWYEISDESKTIVTDFSNILTDMVFIAAEDKFAVSVEVKDEELTLAWNDILDADTYQVQRMEADAWVTLATVNEPFYAEPGVTVGDFTYRILAYGEGKLLETSKSISVSVIENEEGPNVITQPSSQSVAEGEKVMFVVEAEGSGLSYQWQFRTSETAKWTNSGMTGSKTNSITVQATKARNGYQYRCVITDENGNEVTSNQVMLTVVVGPIIIDQPESKTVVVGENATFEVNATGKNLKYQWQFRKANETQWKDSGMEGATTNSITVQGTKARNGYQYRCVITDGSGNQVISEGATLTVIPALVITAQPAGQSVTEGDSATFKVTATGTDLTYQWQFRTSETAKWKNSGMAGSKTNSITVKGTMARNGYQYRCVITDDGGNKVTSDGATLSVQAGVTITAQPAGKTVTEGDKATFTVTASGTDLKYQWQVKTSEAGKWTNSGMAGATTNSITVQGTKARDGYQYRCVVTDGNGNKVTTNAATLTVSAKLAITGQPASKTVAVGENATFTVTATGTGLTYQWQFRTSETGAWKNSGMTGATTNSITVQGTKARDGYQYRCVVTDGSGNKVTSEGAVLTVK